MSISRIVICMVLLGVSLVMIGKSIPQFSNGYTQSDIERLAEESLTPREQWRSNAGYVQYMTIKEKYENESHRMFLGYGLLMISLSIFVWLFSILHNLKHVSDLRSLTTLRSKSASLALVNVAYLGLINGLGADIALETLMYASTPSWDDAWMKGGAISFLFFNSVGLVVVNVIALSFLYHAKLPQPLSRKLPATVVGKFWRGVVFLSILFLALLLILGVVSTFSAFAPFVALWIYIVLGAKALLAERLKSPA